LSKKISEKLSADKKIIPFKRRNIMKQHMPKKRNRWGYKMFVLAVGESDICYDFIFYTGKGERSEYLSRYFSLSYWRHFLLVLHIYYLHSFSPVRNMCRAKPNKKHSSQHYSFR
jgi:hypothetical protein